MKSILILALILFYPVCIVVAQHRNPVSIIFDSDMGPDYDDVGALALLHALADSGQVQILATIASTRYEGVAAVFSVLNTYFKRPEIPIGVPGSHAFDIRDPQRWSDTLLSRYPHSIKKNTDVPNAVEIYRHVLSQQRDGTVTIVTVGFLTNLADLLNSAPDRYSKLSGRDLVRKKVKQLVSMAGSFPSGSEYNVRIDADASKKVFENWPTPVLFSGVEIGMKIKTGLPLIQNQSIRNSPVKDVFRICIPMKAEDAEGRSSWDETAVLVAVKGPHPYYSTQPGRIQIAKDGSNTWNTTGSGQQYLVERLPVPTMRKIIDDLMMHQP
jgi:inosine-uridine nucleoside N-ribohydrolase